MGVTGTVDERITTLAGLQEGRVARRQLLAVGLSPDELKTRIAHRVLVRERAGVYAVGHALPTKRSREVSALLACRTLALVSGADAAGMWALPVTGSADAIEVLVSARSGDRRPPGLIVHRTKDPEHLIPCFIDRIPVTSPAWTLLDVAAVLTPRQLERALDEALAIRIVTLDALRSVISRRPTGRGVRQLRRLVAERQAGDPGARTNPGGEEELLALLRTAGVTGFETNVRLGGWQIDFWFAKLRLAIEVDSYRWHSQRSSWERDRRKDACLRKLGVELLRFTRTEIIEEPVAVIVRIVRRIAELESAAA